MSAMVMATSVRARSSISSSISETAEAKSFDKADAAITGFATKGSGLPPSASWISEGSIWTIL
jgi:hypothetical protein